MQGRDQLNQTQHDTDSNVDSYYEKVVIEGYRPCTVKLPPLITQVSSQKYRDNFVEKDEFRLDCMVPYTGNLSEGGCRIFGDPNYLIYADDNSYFFSKVASKLYFIRDGKHEEVKINDMKKFIKSYKALMKTKECKYYFKHLSDEEINMLITSNGGHTPVIKQPEQKIEMKISEKLPMSFMQDLFPRDKAQNKSAENNQHENHKRTPSCGW